ncbi:unnamed protein product [Ranitomeya imitator]|uniref:Tf2-1-like SH3-like domain-containing protein n=1 Tax=Ranitomeya imitator TaxID=111125 RepID=A0ABN9L4I3_9NEOB|nr:unnamed protein product [Ranitomeya imitator]
MISGTPNIKKHIIQCIHCLQAPPTYEALNQMEYLDMVIYETLRLYPAAGRIERVCKTTTEINGVTIPKDVVTVIPVFVLHRDPELWSDPEEFRPERFSKENRETQDPYIFLPFGAGPRNCIGMRFAMINMKSVISLLLQNFSFRTCKDTPIPLEIDTRGFLKTTKPIILNLAPREARKTESAALNLLDFEFARRCGFPLQPLQNPIPLRGIDATPLAKNKPQFWTQVEPSDCPGVDSVVDRLQQIWAHVVDNLVLSQEEAQRFANRRWISEIINPVSFRLALPASFAIHNVFHRSLLRKYVVPVVPSVDPPAPVLVDGELDLDCVSVFSVLLDSLELQIYAPHL